MSAPRRERKLVVAALARRGDLVLLSQRGEGQAMAGRWEFPGGKVEQGEAPPAALAREIVEELGVRPRVGRIWDVVFHAYPEFDLYMLVYECALDEEPRAVEVARVAWVPRAELPAWDILPADEAIVARLVGEPAEG